MIKKAKKKCCRLDDRRMGRCNSRKISVVGIISSCWKCIFFCHKTRVDNDLYRCIKKGNNRERRKPCGKFSTASRKWKMHVTTKMTICRCRYDIKKKDVVTVTTLYLVDHWWATISRVVEMAKRNQKKALACPKYENRFTVCRHK